MKNKVFLLIIFSLLACVLHAIMLYSPFNQYAFTSITKIVLFTSFPFIFTRFCKDLKFKDFFIFKGDRKNVKISLLLGLGVFAVIWIVFLFIRQFIEREMVIGALANNGITQSNFFLVFIYVVLINASLEELFFRGFIFETLYRRNMKILAHSYSSLLFAVYHVAILREALSLPMMIFCIAGLVAAGLIFNALVVKCKCITGALIVHISANLALNTIILYYLFT
ncbi:MAG: CPBP family intramembrane metalloprotease [Oscillospiraceae bacterium]|nr:CPBP family intramembrane metalloprotease [Oscillospiraceae bacterium]